MRLKYYLRGMGVGIVFATIVCMISTGLHKDNWSKEKIIQEATKLGMAFPEIETEKDTIQEQTNSEQFKNETETELETDVVQEQESQMQQETQTQQVIQTDTPGNVEIILTQDTYASSYGQKVTVRKSTDHPTTEILMTVENGATSEDVAEVLYQCGYIQSVETFNQFMIENAYTKKIRTGEKVIPAGATHEEIAYILITKNN